MSEAALGTANQQLSYLESKLERFARLWEHPTPITDIYMPERRGAHHFIKHGEARAVDAYRQSGQYRGIILSGHSTEPLSPSGREEAWQLGERISERIELLTSIYGDPPCIYMVTSPVRRALETAAVVRAAISPWLQQHISALHFEPMLAERYFAPPIVDATTGIRYDAMDLTQEEKRLLELDTNSYYCDETTGRIYLHEGDWPFRERVIKGFVKSALEGIRYLESNLGRHIESVEDFNNFEMYSFGHGGQINTILRHSLYYFPGGVPRAVLFPKLWPVMIASLFFFSGISPTYTGLNPDLVPYEQDIKRLRTLFPFPQSLYTKF